MRLASTNLTLHVFCGVFMHVITETRSNNMPEFVKN
jgi:hypothetical protein